MSDIEMKDLNDSKELSNEAMAKLSGGYTLYSKIAWEPKTSWSWDLSSTSYSELTGTTSTLK